MLVPVQASSYLRTHGGLGRAVSQRASNTTCIQPIARHLLPLCCSGCPSLQRLPTRMVKSLSSMYVAFSPDTMQ